MVTERIVVVGGGFAGLAVAARLAANHLPVTLLEGSNIGQQASTQNQGWLYSGAWYARRDTEMARLCHESLQQTIRFCPACLEPGHTGMLYFSARASDDMQKYVEAWSKAGIPHSPVPPESLAERLPSVDLKQVQQPYLLPDRSIRTGTLLQELANVAEDSGVEIHTQTCVREFRFEGNRVCGVVTGTGEELTTSLVIMATGASGAELWSKVTKEEPGGQPMFERVALQGHLIATEPGIGAWPFCVVDADGFNHLPHVQKDTRTSVFGTGGWSVVPPDEPIKSNEREFARIETHMNRFLPGARYVADKTRRWSGTTVQAMHIDQIYPGRVPYPAVLDHSIDSSGVQNILSVYPGRATLWSALADQALDVVLKRFERKPRSNVAKPPWA